MRVRMRVRIYIYIWAGVQECLRIVIRAVHGHDYRHKQTFTGGKKKSLFIPYVSLLTYDRNVNQLCL